jgi:hypothetical protein
MNVLETLTYLQLLGQVALIAGALFAGYQFLLHRRERDEHAALEMLTSLQTPEFRSAYAKIWTLPLGASPDTLREHDDEMKEAVATVALTFESLGVMVHNRIVRLDAVDQIIGGFLRESWRRLEPFLLTQRKQLEAPRYAEWYQWLALQVEVRRKRRTVPAYEAFKNWKE